MMLMMMRMMIAMTVAMKMVMVEETEGAQKPSKLHGAEVSEQNTGSLNPNPGAELSNIRV